MNLGYFVVLEYQKEIKELKNTKVDINNLVLRDFDNKNLKHEIIAKDVTYLLRTWGAKQNHLYLSVTISHKTKEILGQKLLMNNDVKLIIHSFDSIKSKTKNVIVYLDHGAYYASSVFTETLKKHHWTHLMSRVRNSFDNKEFEFWFSIFKTELIYNLNSKKCHSKIWKVKLQISSIITII